MLHALHIGVDLVVQTAFKLGALSGQFLRIERDVLIAGGACCHRHEIGHPAGTAERTSARSDATDASGFLTRADLLHLDTHMECVGKHLDELTEIHTLVGYIVEYRFVAVALILHIADFHVQAQILGYLTRTYHCVVLAGFGCLKLFQVGGFCLAKHPAYLGIGAQIGFLYLQSHKLSRQRHSSDVVPRACLHCHHVANLKRQVHAVAVVAFAGVLELHLDHVKHIFLARHIGEPVVAVKFAPRLLARRLEYALLVQIFILYIVHCRRSSYLAKLTERVSRITVIFTCPGYVSSS